MKRIDASQADPGRVSEDMRHDDIRPRDDMRHTAPVPPAIPSFVDVLVPVALDHPYSYRAPRDLDLAPGHLVRVPLGARTAIGVEFRKARAHNKLLKHGFTYRIATRPELGGWSCETIDVVAPFTSISGPIYPVPRNWAARQLRRVLGRLRRWLG